MRKVDGFTVDSFGAICAVVRGWPGRSSLKPSRYGSGTATVDWAGTSAARMRTAITAMVSTSGIT